MCGSIYIGMYSIVGILNNHSPALEQVDQCENKQMSQSNYSVNQSIAIELQSTNQWSNQPINL
jgi:hypothetical protein